MKNTLKARFPALFLTLILAALLAIPYAAGDTLDIPTATVTNIPAEELDEDIPLSFALKFKADEVSPEQYSYYESWFADFELTLNKTAVFNASSDTADGYLAGQYDAWSENWVSVPFEDVELKANETLKIMEYAATLMGQSGLKLTYADVYSFVQEFDCGVYFTPEYLLANPDLMVTLELRMYNPADESESYVIGPTYTFRALDLFGASVANNSGTKYYFALADALAAAQDGDTVELLKNQTLTSQIVIEKDITINGNGFELTTAVQKPLRISADVTINDLIITNTASNGRCIETRVGGITLNLTNVTLNAVNGSTQVLTVGGDAGTDGDITISMNSCQLNSGSIGYGIITFNPVQLTIENSTAVSGYGALYMKGAVSSLGSAGSVVNIKSSFLTSNGRDDGYAFGTVIFEENDITLNVDEKSKIIATNPENSSGRQYAFLFRDSDNDFVPTVYTGITVNVAGLIDADYHICNLISLENTVYIPAKYKDTVATKYLVTDAANSQVRVWAAHTHALTKTGAVSATCTTPGSKEYYTCSVCGAVFADAEGQTQLSVADTVVNATGHTSLTKVEGKPATTTASGIKEHYKCVCGKLFADTQGTQEITNVTLPQLIVVEDNKAQVEAGAVNDALADALEKAETTGKPAEVVIQLPTTPEDDSAEEAPTVEQVQLPTASLEEVALEDASLTVVMPNAAATIDAKALNAIADQAAGSAITLSITQIETAELSDAQQAAIEKLDVAATIQAELICVETQKNIWTAENNATQENTGAITVKIPFAPAEGTKGSDYKVFYVADDGSVKAIHTAYQDGHLIFVLEHFSEYVVVNTALSPDTGDKTMLMPMALLMVLSAACFTVMVVGKKQLLTV